MESFTKEELLPNKYEPKRSNRFILEVPGIDSFMLKEIYNIPLFTRSFFNKKLLKCDGYLIANYYSPISPSIIQQLSELMKEKKFDIVLLGLDPVGTVISKIVFKKCKLDSFKINNLSYDSKETLETVCVGFYCKNAVIDF